MGKSLFNISLVLFLILVIGIYTGSGPPLLNQVDSQCKYDSDNEPTAYAGDVHDPHYDFCYVSDYERQERLYRRKIVNLSDFKFRTYWPLGEIGGILPPLGQKGQIKGSITVEDEPPIRTDWILYDFRRASTEGNQRGCFRRLNSHSLKNENAIL